MNPAQPPKWELKKIHAAKEALKQAEAEVELVSQWYQEMGAAFCEAANHRAKVADALRLVLPMAKAWAHAHPVGANQSNVEHAAKVLARADAVEAEEKRLVPDEANT